MAITRDTIKKRLDRLVRRKGLCPKHMSPLWCVFESEWLGTPAAWHELGVLIHRLEPDLPMPPSGVVCPHCTEPLYCILCGQEFFAGVPARTYDLSTVEYARYQELIRLLRHTPGEHHDKDFFRRAFSPVPTPPPEPAPTPLPPPAPAPVVPTPLQVPVVDEDDEVDAELQRLMREIQRLAGTR
jgi:hypothetical protein